MIINYKKLFTNISVIVFVAAFISSCDTDLYETYDDYVPEKVVSVATVDSVATIAGFENLLFKVFINSDPKIKKAVIGLFDDDPSDDDEKVVATIDISRTVFQPEIYEVEVQLPEGQNEYYVHLEDSEGNESKVYNVFGVVYGESYRQALLQRAFVDIRLYSDTDVETIITWEPNTNELLVKTELIYTDNVGVVQTIVIDAAEDTTIIPNFVPEATFSYTTFYKLSTDSSYILETDSTEGTFPIIP